MIPDYMPNALMTLAYPLVCPACGTQLAMNPKAIGMGAGSWEVQCTACSRILSGGISGYNQQTALAYNQLTTLRRRFVESGNLGLVEEEVIAVAREYDPSLKRPLCDCGASFSIAAKPRCPACGAVAFDSYFHYVFIRRDTKQQSKPEGSFPTKEIV